MGERYPENRFCITEWFFVSHGSEPRGSKLRGSERRTRGLGARTPRTRQEDWGVEEIFAGGEGEPEYVGVRLGPFELNSASIMRAVTTLAGNHY